MPNIGRKRDWTGSRDEKARGKSATVTDPLTNSPNNWLTIRQVFPFAATMRVGEGVCTVFSRDVPQGPDIAGPGKRGLTVLGKMSRKRLLAKPIDAHSLRQVVRLLEGL